MNKIINKNPLEKKGQNKKRGFTLVEAIVAVGLFSIVMMVSLAVILSLIDNNKKTQAINSVVNNLNFAIDSMVRDIKTGKEYHCGTQPIVFSRGSDSGCGGITNPDSIRLISTINNTEKYVMYEYIPESGSDPGKIQKTACQDLICTSPGPTTVDVTSQEINIKSMKFLVNPGVRGVSQPSVFLIIQGTSATSLTDASNFTIQTLISQRDLNI